MHIRSLIISCTYTAYIAYIRARECPLESSLRIIAIDISHGGGGGGGGDVIVVSPVCVDTKNEGRMKKEEEREEDERGSLAQLCTYVEDRTLIYG